MEVLVNRTAQSNVASRRCSEFQNVNRWRILEEKWGSSLDSLSISTTHPIMLGANGAKLMRIKTSSLGFKMASMIE